MNGAAYLARKAIELAVGAPLLSTYSQFEANNLCNSHPNTMAKSIAILRPSMVPIVNLMNEFDKRLIESLETSEIGTIQIDLLKALDLEVEECINLAVETILKDYESWHSTASSNEFVIGTFSRSSTLVSILKRVLQSMQNAFTDTSIRVVCSQSTPGDEGELMANDIPGATCLSDKQFEEHVREGKIDMVIIGADCILSNDLGIVNKIGTKQLARVCNASDVKIKCFADRWKCWDDIYPPPLEEIFEVVPRELLDDVIVPSDLRQSA